MHIITYINGISRNGNIQSKMAIRLNYFFVWQNSYMFLGNLNVTYVTYFYDIKYCGKVLNKSCDTQTKWYFMFSIHGCPCFLRKYISDLYSVLVRMLLSDILIWFPQY